MKTEWERGPFFAEIAEAVGVTTSDVLAAWSRDGAELCALFTRGSGHTSPVLEVTLNRDADGILRGVERDTGQTVGEILGTNA